MIALRPEPGLTKTLEAARALGFDAAGHPLFKITPVEWSAPPKSKFDGILIGSANAIRCGGPQLERLRGLDVYAVGAATAECAAEFGFTVKQVGEGGLQALLEALPQSPLNLLRLAGEAHVPLNPPPHVKISLRIVYRALPRDLPEEMVSELNEGAIVLLHSAAASEHFSNECKRLRLDRSCISLAALGPRIAAAAGAGWKDVQAATTPNDAALLALAGRMCHKTATK